MLDDIGQLKEYLENQFDDKMNWNNYGINWHIDHIMPHTSMEDENFKKCWSLENLRPLDAKQNVSDGSRRTRHKMSQTTDISIYQ